MTKEDFIKAGYSEEQIEKIMSIVARENNKPDNAVNKFSGRKISDIPTSPLLEDKKQDRGDVSEITSIYDLQRYANGQIVKLPDFAEGQPFVARMRRPSLLIMAKKGKIPNKLLATATDLFNGGNSHNASNDSILSDTYDVCEAIAEAALVEPTMAEIKEAGLELSDNQLIAIFNYAQRGIEALNNFR